MEKIKLYYEQEKELKKSLLSKNEKNETIIHKKIIEQFTDGEIISSQIFEEFEIDHGRVDIAAMNIVRDKDGEFIDIHLVELKRGDIDMNAIGQVLRYKAGLEFYIEREEVISLLSKANPVRIYCHLIGKSASCFDGDDFHIMHSIMGETQEFLVHEYSFDAHKGIEFVSYGRCVPDCESSSNDLVKMFKDLNKKLFV